MQASPPAPRDPAPPAVQFVDISRAFSSVPVLKRISFAIPAGSVCGLVGENGAGKSTLMNVLGGNLLPDAGELRLFGRPFQPRHPEDARVAGVAFVHQELNLFPNLSIAENLHLTTFPCLGAVRASGRKGFPWIDRRTLHERTRTLLGQVGLDLDPSGPVERLPAGERQLVEIAKALGAEARVLILDEPTTSLSARECECLFTLIPRLRDRGLAIIYISHTLPDVLRLCDRLVVLRDGEVAGHGPAPEFDEERLVSLMVGRPLQSLYPTRDRWNAPPPRPPRAALEVRSLTQPGVIREISFRLDPGEVLGLAGLIGAGRSELARILFGLDPAVRGEITLGGVILRGPPRRRIARGLAFLPEDRRAEGLCLGASIAENLLLVTLPRYARRTTGWLRLPRMREAVRRIRDAVRLTPSARDEQPVRTLSGGNQQKVVLGKWLLATPSVLILDEPTRGIDVGARFEIYRLIHQMADRGAAILIISSEIEELMGVCDRLLVLRQGALSGEFQRPEFDRERILAAALPAARAS